MQVHMFKALSKAPFQAQLSLRISIYLLMFCWRREAQQSQKRWERRTHLTTLYNSQQEIALNIQKGHNTCERRKWTGASDNGKE